MKTYNLRKNYFIDLTNNHFQVKGKLAFKTEETNWVGTTSSVIVPISIHSNFHQGLDGLMKMQAFTSILKQNVKGTITILMTEFAHLNVLKLKHPDAAATCKRDSQDLAMRFQNFFVGCEVSFWEDFINKDPNYSSYKQKVLDIYYTDETFQKLLEKDALEIYTYQRKENYPNKSLFIEKSIEDILEQCVYLLISIDKSYRLQFYPGKQYVSVEYLNKEDLISLIHVFLSIEKKKIIPLKHTPIIESLP